MRYCPTCRTDAGAPNVRRCRTDENLKALFKRFDASHAKTSSSGLLKEFNNLESAINEKSGVVITMPAGVARNLFENPKLIYLNYEKMVRGGFIKPADLDNDLRRCEVGGKLFGSYAEDIIYGALSLTTDGLPTYGDVHCRLRSVTIDKRTSFLETNSYTFVDDHEKELRSKMPVGFMACWEYRHKLVLSKLASRLAKGQTESDWQTLLIQSDGCDRNNDEFVEAHIYEGFDGNAIDSLAPVRDKKLNRAKRLDMDIALEMFKQRGEGTK